MASSGSGVQIGLRSVSKRYMTASGDAVDALGEIDLDVAAGEFVSIVGPSGCGKSTMMMLVSGLIPATTGTITVGGVRVKGAGGKAGIVFQRDVLLDWRTVFSNVMLPVEIKRLDKETHLKKARDLLRSVGLAEFEQKYPAELSGASAGPGPAPNGRAVRRARRTDPRADEPGPPAHLAARPQHGDFYHPQHRGGGAAVGSRRGDDVASGPRRRHSQG